jgi:hemerythrin-like domain-containing protein
MSSYDLMIMDAEFLRKMVEDKIVHGLTQEVMKKVEILERPNFELQAKEFEARVVVMTMAEHKEQRKIIANLEEEVERLQKFEDAAHKFVDKVDDIDYGTYEMDDDDDEDY